MLKIISKKIVTRSIQILLKKSENKIMKDTITNFKFNESEQLTDRENLNESDSPRNKLKEMDSVMVARDALCEKNFLKLQNFKKYVWPLQCSPKL
jgi:hypothetical protein